MNDDDIRALVTRAGHAPTEAFRTNLRRQLDDQAHGASPAMRLREETDMNNNRTWQLLAAAASIVAVVAIGIIAFDRNGDDGNVIVSDTGLTETTVEAVDTTLPTSDTTLPDESASTVPITPPAATAPAATAPAATGAPATSPVAPPPTDGPAGPTFITDQIDLVGGRAFGFGIGAQVSPDDVLPVVSAVLGQPSHDTGWYTIPGQEAQCMTGVPTRVLWWGSYSMSFFDNPDSGSLLWTWSIGDRSASLQDRNGTEPYTPPAGATSLLATGDGITVGSTETDAVAQYNSAFTEVTFGDGARFYQRTSGNYASNIKLDNGSVTGIAAALVFC